MKIIIKTFLAFCLIFFVGCSNVDNTKQSEDSNVEGKITYAGNFEVNSKVISDDKKEINYSEIDMNVYSNLLFYSNPSISAVQSNVEYINSLCSVKQLRKNVNNDSVYYCKFVNKQDDLSVYIFFENNNEFSTIGLVDMHYDNSSKTVDIINNVGDVDESLINGIADIDLPLGVN